MARATVSPPTPESKTPTGASGLITSRPASVGRDGPGLDQDGDDQDGDDPPGRPAQRRSARPGRRTGALPRRSREYPAARPTAHRPRSRTAPRPAGSAPG